MMSNYIQQSIKSFLDEYKIIPYSMGCTKFFTVKFEGWEKITFTCEDETLNDLIELIGMTAQNIINKYKDTYAFTEPQFFWQHDGTAGIKIGAMPLELYDQLMEKRNDK
jgi:hypothetical protein